MIRQSMFGVFGAVALSALCAGASAAPAEEPAAATQTPAESVFVNQDVNGDGFISPREYDFFRLYLLLSLDFDSDGKVSTEEWNSWDPRYAGLEFEATQAGLVYSAMANLFITVDTDVDGAVSEAELSTGLFRDFAAVDQDQNGYLNASEFDQGFLLPHEIETRVAQLIQPPA